MPDYYKHCLFNYVVIYPAILVVFYALHMLDIAICVFIGLGIYLGTAWLTPDLDINSKVSNKNRIWSMIWWPYRTVMKHRGDSHKFIIGFIGRIIYISMFILLISYFLGLISWISTVVISIGYTIILTVCIGIAVGNAGHIILDEMI